MANFTPINPNLPPEQMAAMLNKNFADVSGKTFLSGTYTFPAVTVAAGTNEYQKTSIKHGMRFIPAVWVFGFLTRPNMYFEEQQMFPNNVYKQLTYYQAIEGGNTMGSLVFFGADETNVIIGRSLMNGSGSPITSFTYTVRYFALREFVG